MFCTVYVFFPLCFDTVIFEFVCLGDEEEECSYHPVPSGSAQPQIDKRDAFLHFLSAQSFVQLLAFRKRWPVLTLAAVWKLLVDDRECLALLEV